MHEATDLTVWRAGARGQLRTDWLDARLTLNFGPWSAPGRDRFGPLRVLNDDRVDPGAGFGMHGHRDLDILMVPLSTPIEHRDSEGRHQWVRPGEIQWMRAGRGVAHSQMNASNDRVDRHLQLWVEPDHKGLHTEVWVHPIGPRAPGRWQALCGEETGLFQPDAPIGLWLGWAAPGQVLSLGSAEARLLQVVHGPVWVVTANGLRTTLEEGDALVFHQRACPLLLRGADGATVLRVETPALDPATGRWLAQPVQPWAAGS
ncbi:pirin family protein [Hydrogenophaga sp. XSHU_21]